MIGAKCSWRVQGKHQDGCAWIGRAESAALNRTLTEGTGDTSIPVNTSAYFEVYTV